MENNNKEADPRFELRRLVKEELIAAGSTAHNAEEREKKAEEELQMLLKKHPELESEVEKVREHFLKELSKYL